MSLLKHSKGFIECQNNTEDVYSNTEEHNSRKKQNIDFI